MPDIKKMFEVCRFAVSTNARIIDICEEFNLSRRTAQKYTGEYLRNYIAETNDETAIMLLAELEKVKSKNEDESFIKKTGVDLKEVINYIITTKTSIYKAALTFGISESTIQKYIAQLKTEDVELYNKLREAQVEISKNGHILGGKTGVRGPKYTDFESTEIAEVMLEDELTLAAASDKFNMPKSSIYERIKAIDDSELQDDLQEMFDRKKIC